MRLVSSMSACIVAAAVLRATIGPRLCRRYENDAGVIVPLRVFGVCGRDTEHTEKKLTQEPLKLFVAGMAKTGTSSMKQALEGLGYKVYHNSELAGSSSQVSAWHNEALAHRDQPKRGDGDKIFDAITSAGYNATTDFPTCLFWREALRRYPSAKFILTVRDTPGHFARSWGTMMGAVGHMLKAEFRLIPRTRHFAEVMDWMLTLMPGLSPEEGLALGHGFEFLQRLSTNATAFAKLHSDLEKSYEIHNSEVVRGIPSKQLLIFNVKQGFSDGKLCSFLNVPKEECPKVFPHANDKSIFTVVGVVLFWVRFSWLWIAGVIVYASLAKPSTLDKSKVV